ncbi:T9SS type A sorting domain-containing protein [Prevotella intermedia]|uniref:T9SS type A sorting domain-containing protein n=1 Tax=Prevotella intermedia TaxID=28131 RepID=UPI00397BA6D6
MKVKTKLLFTLVLGLWSGALSVVNASVAQNKSQDEYEKSLCLVVKLQAGGESIFFLGENPKLSYFADSLAVVYHDQQLNFALEDLKDYHFEEREPTGIGQIKEQGVQQGQTNFSQGLAVFRNYPAGSKITVFTSEGRRVATVVTNKEGCAQLDMREQPSGIYIINVGKRSFKWLKN